MHSRLYTRVLNQYPWMHNCTAFNSLYNETGIVGIFASAESNKAESCVDVLTKELQVGIATRLGLPLLFSPRLPRLALGAFARSL